MALEKIGALFDIERLIAGSAPECRQSVRQRLAKPRLDELAAWLDAQLQKILPNNRRHDGGQPQ